MTDALLEVRDLRVDFESPDGSVHAVRGASFALAEGEILGIVGESGCGKSTVARGILKLVDRPGRIVGGSVLYQGRDLLTLPDAELRRVRGDEISMIFQNPATSLNPVLTVGKQIAAVIGAHRDVSKAAVRAEAIELLGNLGIPAPERRVDQYPYELSGGMRQRVMIAMALANSPKVVIADEATTALDVTVQAQILDLLRDVNRELRTSIVFISHNLGVVAELCHRVAVFYGGRVVETGPVDQVFGAPRHPYTRALLASLPAPGAGGRRLAPVPGAPPVVTDALAGCSFAPRCPLRMERCTVEDPSLDEVETGHEAACWAARASVPPAVEEACR